MPGRLAGKVAIVTGAASRGQGVGTGKATAMLKNGNLKSMMLCCKYSIPHMIATGGGSIINISSLAAVLSVRRNEGFVAYAASKAGVHGLTLSVAADFAAEGIQVNCLVVDTIYTPMVAEFLSREAREQRRRRVPLGTEGTAWDVGWAAVYLASDEARWVTGAFLPVDGGLMLFRDSTV